MQILPVIPSVGEYTFDTALDGRSYFFRFYWNRDDAWYFDLYEGGDRTPIAYGIKVVLGTYLGRMYEHEVFRTGVFAAIDRSGELRDATFHDFGDRVLLVRITDSELLAAQG